jgi:hypothetical protein
MAIRDIAGNRISMQIGSDPDTFAFRALYVNGHLSNTGIDKIILRDGDVIPWNYEVYSPSTHNGTRSQRMRDAGRVRKRNRGLPASSVPKPLLGRYAGETAR